MHIISLLFLISLTFAGAFLSCTKQQDNEYIFVEDSGIFNIILNGKIDGMNSNCIFDIETLISVGIYEIKERKRKMLLNKFGVHATGLEIQKQIAHDIFNRENVEEANVEEAFDENNIVHVLKFQNIMQRLNDVYV